jgi:hypothetical protein
MDQAAGFGGTKVDKFIASPLKCPAPMVGHSTHPCGLRYCHIGYVNNDLTHEQLLS